MPRCVKGWLRSHRSQHLGHAPGGAGPCGEQATRALAGRIGGRTVSCEERDQDRHGRVVAVCHVAGGENLNAWMVRQGWALA